MKQAFKIDASDLSKLHKALTKVDKQASRQLTGRLRKIVTPIANEVRNAALSLPSRSDMQRPPQPSLRSGIAKAVQLKMGRPSRGAYVRIRVSGSKFQQATGRSPRLPRLMEGRSKRPWRHPVWAKKGDDRGQWKGAWVAQDPHAYLIPTVAPHRDRIAAEMVDEYLDTFDAVFRAEGL